MTPDRFVFWFFVVAWAAVVVLIAGVQLPSIVGELRRILRHAVALIEQTALVRAVDQAELDVQRLERAIQAAPPLIERAQAAIATVRSTPLVPPAITSFRRRLEREIAEFRRLAG